MVSHSLLRFTLRLTLDNGRLLLTPKPVACQKPASLLPVSAAWLRGYMTNWHPDALTLLMFDWHPDHFVWISDRFISTCHITLTLCFRVAKKICRDVQKRLPKSKVAYSDIENSCHRETQCSKTDVNFYSADSVFAVFLLLLLFVITMQYQGLLAEVVSFFNKKQQTQRDKNKLNSTLKSSSDDVLILLELCFLLSN